MAKCVVDMLPRSAGSWIGAPVAIIVALTTYLLLQRRDLGDIELAIAVVGAVSIALAAIEYCAANQGIERPKQTAKEILTRALRHWLDAMLGVAVVLLFWWLLDAEYGRQEYRALGEARRLLLPAVPVVVLVGTLAAAWRLGTLRETDTPLADLVLSLGQQRRREAMTQSLLALLVRAVFLPLNFCVLVQGITYLRSRDGRLFTAAGFVPHEELLLVIYTMLIATIVPGYLFASRLISTQVRHVDTTLLGWAATLLCYRPLSIVVFDRWLNYRAAADLPGVDRTWSTVAGGLPSLAISIGIIIILLELLHLWAEASFGLRSSNLCNRGIITHGPYRWCKHPIYAAKCAGWLLIYLPFAMSTAEQSLRATVLFSAVCALYAVRAYAEERLLANETDYVAYALWIDNNGVFAGLGRIFPTLTFRERMKQWPGATVTHAGFRHVDDVEAR